MKILIVDDDDLNVEVLDEILKDAGFETITANDGLEAITQLEQDSDIEIVLLDRMMPNMNGMEVMEKMQAHPEWSQKAVIMQTVADSRKEVIEGSETGVYYYLTKPYDDKMVLSIVRAAVDDLAKTQGGDNSTQSDQGSPAEATAETPEEPAAKAEEAGETPEPETAPEASETEPPEAETPVEDTPEADSFEEKSPEPEASEEEPQSS